MSELLALIDKAKRWHQAGIISQSQLGAVAMLVFCRLPEEMSQREIEHVIESGLAWIAAHPNAEIVHRIDGVKGIPEFDDDPRKQSRYGS